ncbi:hypothetical protein [Luteolibacter sp. Populi]|uniref:hypothetical protein n=1 Tax=Luteolibacter sp. Populi TaxID=3230487 RepID=UPI00346663F0
MSWTDIFPLLDDSMIEAFEAGVTTAEREEFAEWFEVKEIHRPDGKGNDAHESPEKHVVSVTLFWKHVNGGDPDLPVPTRDLLIDARRLGLVKRFSPWDCYIDPIFLYGPDAMKRHPEASFRIYLAADLDFLIPELIGAGWEVHLMRSPSIRYCPGGFWRFLALEEAGTLVTVIDSDRIGQVSGDIERTELMNRLGLSLWRVPGYYNADTSKEVRYRPILGGHFGARGGSIPVRKLIETFIWHWRHGSLPLTANIPGYGERPMKFANWPDYGFDEWFQLAAMYPHLAPGGTLSFIPVDARSMLLPVDIEYATWANPKSETVYF